MSELPGPPLLCHLNLAHTFRGGERQAELLIRGLAARLPAQRVIVRAGRPLGRRLHDVPGVTVVPVRGRLAAVRAAAGAALVHAHETGGAQAAFVRHLLSGTPYLITRRVDHVPKADPFTRAMYRRAAVVVGLSDAIVSILRRYDARLSLRKIPSAASLLASDAQRVRACRERFAGGFVVGHVAELDDAHKGQLLLIEAAARIERTQPDIHFVLVGSGRDEERLKGAARGLRNVTFAGWADNVGDYLAAFDLFVLPSRKEGLGSILIDAMQFGLPVVATAVGGIPELVTHGVNGLLVEQPDSAALAAAVLRLHGDAELRGRMSRANRERAREYGPEKMTERYLALYAELLPAFAARGPA